MLSALRRSPKARMWVTVVSCMGILMSLSAISYFGAILNYLYSFYQSHKPAVVYMDPLWMLTTYQVIAPVGMTVGSSLASKYWGNVRAVIFYVIINALSAFAGYYTICEPLALLGTYGLLQGFCSGALFNLIWKICMSCCDAPVSGTATGIMGAGTPIGALAISELSLLVVNPGNKRRDGQSQNMHYFSDPELLDRVPYMFIMNGAFCVLVHFTSCLLLGLVTLAERQAENLTVKGRDYGAISDVPEVITPALTDSGSIKAILTTSGARHLNVNTASLRRRTMSINASLNEEFLGSVRVTAENNVGLTPGEMVRTGTFWNLWILNLVLNFSLYIYMNLYKEFGAHYFNNDALLTNVCVLANVAMIFSRPLFGMLVDRYGVKSGLLVLTSSSTVFIWLTMLSLYFHQPAAYVLVTVLQINSISTLWLVFNYAAKESFGPAHYSANSGIMFTAIIPPYIACAGALPWLVANVGMMNVFMGAVVFAAVSFFLAIIYPESQPGMSRKNFGKSDQNNEDSSPNVDSSPKEDSSPNVDSSPKEDSALPVHPPMEPTDAVETGVGMVEVAEGSKDSSVLKAE